MQNELEPPKVLHSKEGLNEYTKMTKNGAASSSVCCKLDEEQEDL